MGRRKIKQQTIPTAKEPATSSGSEDEDWEEVDEKQPILDEKPVELDFALPAAVVKQHSKKEKKRQKIKCWLEMYMKRIFNNNIKEIQYLKHKTHLLCLLANGMLLNEICNNETLLCLALSIVPSETVMKNKVSEQYIKNILLWIRDNFGKSFDLKSSGMMMLSSKIQRLIEVLQRTDLKKNSLNRIDWIMLHVLFFRSLGVMTRFVFSLDPVPHKPPTKRELGKLSLQYDCSMIHSSCDSSSASKRPLSPDNSSISIPQVDGANDHEHMVVPEKRKKVTSNNPASHCGKENSKSQCKPTPPKRKSVRIALQENRTRSKSSNKQVDENDNEGTNDIQSNELQGTVPSKLS